MNRNKIILIVATMIILLSLASCKKDGIKETTVPAESTPVETESTVPQESIVADGVISGAEVEEEEETKATEPEQTEETTPKETEEDPKETTKSTEGKDPEETTAPTEDTDPEETTAPTEAKDSEEATTPNVPSGNSTEYEAYMNMSADEQQAFIDSFGSIEAFMAWFNSAKADYDATDGSIDIGSGSVDLEDIINGNG